MFSNVGFSPLTKSFSQRGIKGLSPAFGASFKLNSEFNNEHSENA